MCKYIVRFVVELMIVIVVKINKAVVGSGHGDMPKYVGEGVALHGTPGTLGVPLPWYSCLSTAILGNFGWVRFGCSASDVHHLICQCYVIKWHCDVICDVTAPHVHWSRDLLL